LAFVRGRGCAGAVDVALHAAAGEDVDVFGGDFGEGMGWIERNGDDGHCTMYA